MTLDPGTLASLPVHVRQQLADLLRAIASAVERGDEDSVCALAGALNRPPSHPHVPPPSQGSPLIHPGGGPCLPSDCLGCGLAASACCC